MNSFTFFLVTNTKQRFQHDKRNRLTRIQKGTEVLEQKYDDYGRLADNPKRGEYHYTTSRYVLDSITLNASGLKYYKEHPRQDVQYNMDRKAVSVHEHEFGWADFAYNAQMQRTHAWYGGEEENLNNRTYQKHYSSLFPAEITVNNETGKTDIVHYIGGDGYTAPVAKINDEVHYLHRDYLGSILAISDSSGSVVEERQFGAWGEIDYIKINGQESDFSDSILPRGFTGHEHFTEIALIHMNGRMYDPQMRRFLSPDNFVQEPYDTRSYDRFGYVWQNPLMNSDSTGELIETAFVALQLVKFISAGLNLYNLGNSIFGGFNNAFTYGPTGGPQVVNTNSNFNRFLNSYNQIDGVYLSSTHPIQDSILRQDQNTFLDGPPKHVELYPQYLQQEKPDWNKISDQERIYEILKAIRSGNQNGLDHLDLNKIFRNYPNLSTPMGNRYISGDIELGDNIIEVYLDAASISDVRFELNPQTKQIQPGQQRFGTGNWDKYLFNGYRGVDYTSFGVPVLTIEVPSTSNNVLYNYLNPN